MEGSGAADALRAVQLGDGQRYDVMITNREGRVVTYRVATRISRDKATAIAVAVFTRHYPDPNQQLFGVSVREAGSVRRVEDENGNTISFELDDHDLVDAMEWA
jgi:hypothetical protein